ncbi:MAG: U32 family peptidase, partial [Lachnospiraceae bacterium]|nr:U32 family peptidase [Lachnospiraceae bacterium]
MMNRKIELLAPAGDFACFQAALNAGADAVYLGGEQYGARAYAGNFSSEEIKTALHTAHLFGRKVYLTVNTLVKQDEFENVVPYITPLYQAGLDGVIVQDIGVLVCLRERFPDLALHASTQMTITGHYGADFLKKMGVCRIVPARELSLDEIKDMKERTNLEIESFIHGAMCYAYSGQCLFSSILGGRSGNRGRCAGPCRLPYIGARGKEQYPLSLKDLYTLPVLPKLIEAGIDSFKIEGRMKSPEYVAGVTAIYRKYLDAYLENPEKEYMILPKDEQLIRHLYIRSDTCGGYYQQHHNKDMITLAEPGYSGSKQEVLSEIQEKYIAGKLRLPINGYVRICAGSPAVLTFSTETASVTVTGEMVSPARNKPLSQEDIRQKLGKLGDTCFQLTALVVDTDDASFMAVKALNELRRIAAAELEQKLLAPTLRTVPELSLLHI